MIRVLLALVLLTPALASDEAALRRMIDSKRQVHAWLELEAQRLTSQAASEIQSPAAWAKVREQRLSEMRDMLGLLPWPERTPLNATITGKLDKGSYTIEKLAFESIPKFYVTANLYLPKGAAKAPAIIYVCGHSAEPAGAKVPYQRHGISLAKNGYAALIIDPIQIAETFALHHGVYSQEIYEWYSRGYTPAGVEVWNAMRAIDYLETLPEIDAARIGMTGRSGGAAMSWFTAAVDPRVKVVVPVMGISTYAANLREDTQRLHCDCMFPINHYRHDMMHQGALISPRPLLMAHGRKDALFPVAGYKEFEKTVGAMYPSGGFRNIEVDTGHQDSDYLREQAIRWFDEYLMRVPSRKLDLDYSNAPPEQLAVYSGKPPADAINHRVHEMFPPTPARALVSSAAEWQQRRTELGKVVSIEGLRLQTAFTPQLADMQQQTSGWNEYTLQSGEGITLRALIRRPKQAAARAPALIYVASDGDDPAYLAAILGGLQRRGKALQMVVYPRGNGEIGWDRTFWKATLRNAMHVGQTIDSMRLADAVQSFRALARRSDVDPARITMAGKGIAGALALYAALVEPRIHQVVLLDAPESHRQGPIFLGILRHTDLPEAAAMLAPRRLNFYSHMPRAFEKTRRIYGLLGQGGKVFTTMSLDGVVDGRYDHGYSSGY